MARGIYGFRKNITRLIFIITSVIFFIWLSYVLKVLYFIDFHEKTRGIPNAVLQLSVTIFGIGALIGLYRVLSFQTAQRIINNRYFLILIISVTLITRLTWIWLFGEVKPFSDFDLYMTLASSIAAGEKIPAAWQWYVSFAPYVIGYASFLAFLFTIFGQSVVVAQIANAVLSSLIAVLLFLIGKKITGKTVVGVLAAVLLIAMPSQAAMSLFPGTELPYITLLLAVFYVFLHIPNRRVRISPYVMCIAAVALTVLMNEIRPLGILSLAVFCVFFWFTNRFTSKTTVRNVLLIVLFMTVYFISSSLLNNLKDNFNGLPIARNAYGFGLFLGLNYDTTGHWSQEDSSFLGVAISKGLTAQQFHQQMIGYSIGRLSDLIHRNLLVKLVYSKIGNFWSHPNIFLEWTPLIAGASPKNTMIVKGSMPISNGIYGMIILFSIIETVLFYRRKDYAYSSRSHLIKMMLLAMLAMHAIFDANERYVTPAFPLLILLAVNGFQDAVGWSYALIRGLFQSKAVKVSRSF